MERLQTRRRHGGLWVVGSWVRRRSSWEEADCGVVKAALALDPCRRCLSTHERQGEANRRGSDGGRGGRAKKEGEEDGEGRR